MKSVVKFAKSLHVDSHTLNAMFIGYFVLLIVVGTFIVKNGNGVSGENSAITASSEVSADNSRTN